MKQPTIENFDGLSLSQRHLLLSFPDPELQFEGAAVVDHMVEGAIHAVLHEKGIGGIVLVTELQGKVLALTGLRYETVELIAAAERLATAKHLRFCDPKHLSFVFSADRYDELDRKLQQQIQRDTSVRETWENEVRQRHDLTGGQLDRLWKGLEQLTTAILSTHAAETAAFLYQGYDSERIGFSAALAARYPSVDELVTDDLKSVAEEEFPHFFDIEASDRRNFLLDRLQGVFVFHLLNIDPQASELVRSNVSEKILYLDTNFLYRLLGIQGPALAHGPATTALVSEQLNCRLVVTQETVDEFVRSLRNEVTRIRSAPIERTAYQRIAANQDANDWAFAQAYYRELLSGRVSSVDEFERKYSNIIAFLEEWKIEIDENAWLSEAEQADPSFRDLWSALNQWHKGAKGVGTINHDVFVLRHVRHLRGESDLTLGRVKTWLLTYDRGLTAFSVSRAARDRFSPCILADSWLQLTRPFLPRTEEYERAFVSMLQHPLLSRGRDSIPFEHVAEALNRLERYRELPPAVVAAMVADGEFHRRLDAARDPEAEKQIIELTFQRLANEAIGRAEMAQEKLGQALHRMQTLEETVAFLNTKNEDARLETDEMRRTAEEQKAHFRAKMAGVPDQVKAAIGNAVEKVRQENEETTRTLASAYGRTLRWIAYGSLLTIITVVVGVSVVLLGAQMPSVTIAVTAAWWVVVALTLLAIPFWHRLGTVIAAVSLAIAVLGAVGLTFQLMTAADSEKSSAMPVRKVRSTANGNLTPVDKSGQSRNIEGPQRR